MEKHQDVERIMLGERKIQKRVKELAAQLDKLYEGRTPLVVCILKGSTIFFADLVRSMKTALTIDFMAVSSYGAGTTSGELKIKKDLTTDIKGRDVLIVEDIIDSGNTLSALKALFLQRGANSVACCCLLDKKERRTADIEADYVGFEVPDEFLVGYGLDYAGKYRNLKYVGTLRPEVYSN